MTAHEPSLGPGVEKELRRLERGLWWAAFRDAVAQASVLALFLAGALVLVLRRALPDHEDWLAPGLWALGGALLFGAALRTWRHRLGRSDLLAWADRRAAAGGLLLTLSERRDPRWLPLAEARLREVEAPRLRLHRRTRLFLPALAFFGLCALVPAAEAEEPVLRDAGERFTKRLEERVERMAEEELLRPPERAALIRELERLRRDLAREGLGARQWEALDTMRRRLDERLDERARAMARAARAGREAASPETRRDRALGARAAAELAESLRGLDIDRMLGRLPADLRNAALAELARQAAGLDLDAGDLASLDPAALEAALAALERWLGDEADLLAACDCQGDGLGALREALKGRPGRGGVNRGRADARLEFAGETPEQKGRFVLDRLKPKAAGDRPGELLSLRTREGDEGPDASAVRGPVRTFSDTEQDLVGKRRVLPRHRGVVKRFFDGQGPDDGGPAKTNPDSEEKKK